MNFDEIIGVIEQGIKEADSTIVDTDIFHLMPEDMTWGSTTLWGILDWIQALIVDGVMACFQLSYQLINIFSDVKKYLPSADLFLDGIADIATLILGIIFLKQIFTNYILDIDGEADADPIQALVNIAVALAVINCGGEIHNILMKVCDLAMTYIRELIGISSIDYSITFTEVIIQNLLKAVGASVAVMFVPGGAWVLIFAVVWLIVVCVLMLVLGCKLLFRGVELFIFQCLMPIFACDLVTPNKELWKPFFKAYLITIFGWLIQYTCLMLSITILANFCSPSTGIEGLMSPLISTVMLYFACKAPKWLQNFTYQTGAGQAVSSGARGIVGTASSVVSAATSIK